MASSSTAQSRSPSRRWGRVLLRPGRQLQRLDLFLGDGKQLDLLDLDAELGGVAADAALERLQGPAAG